jgi:hypothetical protein
MRNHEDVGRRETALDLTSGVELVFLARFECRALGLKGF